MQIAEINICLLTDQFDKSPVGVTVKWSDIVELLETHTVTKCTLANGPDKCAGKQCVHKSKLPPNACEGFSAWMPIKSDGQGRKLENTEKLTVLVLDIDHVHETAIDGVLTRLAAQEMAYVCHWTHNHAPPADGCYRVVMPLTRDVTPGEFADLRAKVTEIFAIPNDRPTRNVNRLFYLPTTRADVTPFCEISGYDNGSDGKPLDVDGILATVVKKVPSVKPSIVMVQSEEESEPVTHDFAEIRKSLLKFASGRDDAQKAAILRRAANGKALALPGHASDVVDPDGVPHGRDSAIGQLTWTIPWIDGVGDVDEDALCEFFAPCFRAMADDKLDAGHWKNQFLTRLGKSLESFPERKREIEEKKALREQEKQEMREVLGRIIQKKKPAVQAMPENIADKLTHEEISEKLEKHPKSGQILATHNNLLAILMLSVETGTIRFNDNTKAIEVVGGLFAGLGVDVLALEIKSWLGSAWGLSSIAKQIVEEAVLHVAYKNRVNPLQDYLRGLVWDGKPRIDNALIELANAKTTDGEGEDITEFVRAISRKWFVSVVARALKPGCQVDTMLIFKGDEGLKKTTFFRKIGGEHFATSVVKMGDKDSKLSASSAWIIEYGEMASLRRSHGDDIKSHLSETEDFFRAPYARSYEKTPRTCVFVGTTNDDDVLPNDKKNRRFWVIEIEKKIDAARVQDERDQLLAEAVHVFLANTDAKGNPIEANSPWWLTDDEQEKASSIANENKRGSTLVDRFLQKWVTLNARPEMLASLDILDMVKDEKGLPTGHNENSAMKEISTALVSMNCEKLRKRIGGNPKTIFKMSQEMLEMKADDVFGVVGKPKLTPYQAISNVVQNVAK